MYVDGKIRLMPIPTHERSVPCLNNYPDARQVRLVMRFETVWYILTILQDYHTQNFKARLTNGQSIKPQWLNRACSELLCMQQKTVNERTREFLSDSKVKLVGLAAAGSGLVASASADIDLNATIGPILDSVISLIPSIINLIVAVVPAIICMAVVGFIVAFFDKILGMMKL